MKNKTETNKKKKGAKVKLFKSKKNISSDEVIEELQAAYEKINPKEINKFSDFPFSFKTLKGLRENDYIIPTDIQKESIGCALQGIDILGAAKTGSGKTLAFLIPVLERLFCKKWTRLDGTGALIITPTRELAYQIFETLRKVGFYHDFSAGLIIGGKDLKFETKRMDQCNIVICTPGRLLHHMDENPLFDCVNLQILVLDEADRCLDMGFEDTMNSIIENLPPNRQTLLFSATQTKSVRDLARLSLVNPKYISVHENSSYSTPEGLTQSYMICELEDKLAVLWSFIKNHYKHKILVFLASCKQVKYVFEVFCQLRPGIALLALYGSLHQQRRMDIYRSFCNKEHAVLFATDIASRGLDFPAVNWVIQMDCPEDATTYIHRVGRTARYHKGGEALLVLLPSEAEAMLTNLNDKKIPINEIKVNPKKLQNPRIKIEAMLAKKPEFKESAQRAFVSYIKSVFLMKDKNVFNVHKLDTDSYARSLGLVVSPRIRFLQRMQKKQMEQEKTEKKSLKSGKNVTRNSDIKEEIKFENFIKSEPESSDEEENRNNFKNRKNDNSVNEIITKIKSEADIKSETESEDDDSEEVNDNKIPTKIKLKSDIKSKLKYSDVTDDSDNEFDETQSIKKKSSKLDLDSKSKNLIKRFQTFDFGIDDSDSEEEILKIKRTDHALDNDDGSDSLVPVDDTVKRKKKPLTRAAIAKRILKKNIVPNKKTLFTEEGLALENKFKQRVTELGKSYEQNIEGGGISIEEAQRVLKEEDKIDRVLFKERIKAKHREERIKLKKLRKGEESESDKDEDEDEQSDIDNSEENFDKFNGSDSEENYSNSSQEEDDDSNNSSDDYDDNKVLNDNGSDSEEHNLISRNFSNRGVKRKQASATIKSKKIKGSFCSSDSLLHDQELALKLLSAKR